MGGTGGVPVLSGARDTLEVAGTPTRPTGLLRQPTPNAAAGEGGGGGGMGGGAEGSSGGGGKQRQLWREAGRTRGREGGREEWRCNEGRGTKGVKASEEMQGRPKRQQMRRREEVKHEGKAGVVGLKVRKARERKEARRGEERK